jgi:hypothetical protein
VLGNFVTPFALNFTLAAVEPGALSFWMDSGVGPTYKQNKSHVLKMHVLIHVDLHKINPTALHSQKVHQLRPCTIEHGTPLAG